MRNSNNQNGYRGKRIAGNLSLVVEYAEEAIDTATMKKIKAKAMELLFQE